MSALNTWTDAELIAEVEKLRKEAARYRIKAIESTNEKVALAQRVIKAETAIEAVKAGLIDVAAAAFIDLSEVKLGPDGGLVGADAAVEDLKKRKQHFFYSD